MYDVQIITLSIGLKKSLASYKLNPSICINKFHMIIIPCNIRLKGFIILFGGHVMAVKYNTVSMRDQENAYKVVFFNRLDEVPALRG